MEVDQTHQVCLEFIRSVVQLFHRVVFVFLFAHLREDISLEDQGLCLISGGRKLFNISDTLLKVYYDLADQDG